MMCGRRGVLGMVAACLVVATGCSNANTEYSRLEALALAKRHFQGQGVQYYDVVSAGVGRDTIFVWMSALGYESSARKRLSKVLRSSGPQRLNLAISGPVPAKTYQIARGALESAGGLDLDHVHVLLIGSNGDRTSLLQAAGSSGVHLTLLPMSALREARNR